MLYQLSIRNVAIIEAADVPFGEGLNILTGETGAGKSILIDSLNLVLGARANRELIRKPAQSARVEAVFGGLSSRARGLLEAWGLEPEEETVISREIWENGRSTARVNGSLISLAQLKALGALLVDVHGQHEYRYLLDPTQHTRILDSYAGPAAKALLEEVKAVSAEYSALKRQLDEEFGDDAERERRMDILRYQIKEIEAAAPRLGEDEELEQERSRMQNAERLREAVTGAYRMLSEGASDDGDSPSARSLVDMSSAMLDRASDFDTDLKAPAEQLTQIGYALEDVIETLRDMAGSFDFDDYRLEEVENRLELLRNLKRKYGRDLEAVLRFAEEAAAEYDRYDNAGATLERMQSEMDALRRRWQKAADRLTALRKETADDFTKAVLGQLKDLGMADARFEVRFAPAARELSAEGAETAAFWLSANKGEEPGPLDKVASGGELSRIMLSLKAVVADTDDIPTMVFDEIDAGISGNMARMVGQKLLLIACRRQVLCITHTAQIAAMGDEHYLIRKAVEGERTLTHVMLLPREERIREIGRLVGGDMTGDVSIAHAGEMIRWCDEYKKTLRFGGNPPA